MPLAEHTIGGVIHDIVGDPWDPRRISVWVESSAPLITDSGPPWPLRIGTRHPLDPHPTTGVFALTLPDSTQAAVLYTLWVQRVEPAGPDRQAQPVKLGEFEVTSNAQLANILQPVTGQLPVSIAAALGARITAAEARLIPAGANPGRVLTWIGPGDYDVAWIDGAGSVIAGGYKILGSKTSPEELPAGAAHDAWLIGPDLWVWGDADDEWHNTGPLNPPGPQGVPGVGLPDPEGLDGQVAVVRDGVWIATAPASGLPDPTGQDGKVLGAAGGVWMPVTPPAGASGGGVTLTPVPGEPGFYAFAGPGPQTLNPVPGEPGFYALAFADPTTPEPPQPGTDLLIGKTFTSTVADSVSEPNNGLGNITDQDTDTRWISQPASPVTLTVDLEAVYDLSKIVIVWAADTIRHYTVQVSTNGADWTTILTGETDNTTKQTVEYQEFAAQPVGQYLRIVGADRWNPAYGNSIYDVAAFGDYVAAGSAAGAITGLTATPDGANEIDLAWTYTGAPLSGIEVLRNGVPLTSLSGAAATYTDTGLAPSTSYTYTLRGVYALTGASTAPATATATTTAGTAPDPSPLLAGLSGKPWNASLFTGLGSMAAKATQFGTWRGTPVDGLLFFSTRASWDSLLNCISWEGASFPAFPGYKIISVSSQPNGQNCSETASGARNTWWQGYGAMLAASGLNNSKTIIRLNWECNIQGWGVNKPTPQVFAQAYRNVVNSIRVNAPNVLFSHGYSSGNWPGVGMTHQQVSDLIGPGEFFDIIEIDAYDHSPGALTQALFNQQGARNPGRDSVYQYAVDKGIYCWVMEHGASHSEWNSGGDNPLYWSYMHDWCQARAVGNGGRLLGENTYNHDGAPASWKHTIFDYGTNAPTAFNANSAARHKQLW